MKRYVFLLSLLALSVTPLLAEEHVIGGKQKPDPELQEKAVDPGDNFPFMAGDTIVISTSQTHYLTGEKIANWVYYVEHAIQQIGSKRFPDGILIKGILSWVKADEGELLLMGPVDRGDEAQNALVRERMGRDKQKVDSILQTLTDTTRQQADSLAQLLDTKTLEQIQAEAEQARQDSLERVRLEAEAAAQRLEEERVRVADSIAQARADSTAAKEHIKRLGAQHRFSIGLRSGTASHMQQTVNDEMGRWGAGFDAMLDLQYAYYFGAREGKTCNLGVITGLSVGYARSPLKSAVDTTYTEQIFDPQLNGGAGGNEDVVYTIHSDQVKEADGQIQVEIPLLFSLRHESGVFFNAGPKLILPVYSHYKQTLAEEGKTYISAYYPSTGVTVTNEYITGKVPDDQYTTTGKWRRHSSLYVALTAELGYEWTLRNGDAIGLGAYGNYAAYTAFAAKEATSESLIQVGNPGYDTGVAPVSVISATDAYANKLGFFDCGLKLVYHFGFYQKQ